MSNEIVLGVPAEYEEAAVGQDLIKVETVERRRVDVPRIAAEGAISAPATRHATRPTSATTRT
jgi:hypothetical protein